MGRSGSRGDVVVDHAVVIGASMAGLEAAAALHPHVRHVTIIERDELPERPENRRGVPQGHHAHAIMTGGRAALDELLPGFSEEMVAAGAPLLDQPRDIAFLTVQGWLARAPTGVETFFTRRIALEHVVRTLVRRLDNVTFVQGAVSRLTATSDGGRVTGVALNGSGSAQAIEADLVVDASGRASRAPKWLEELGYGAPPEVEVRPFLGYASRLLRIPADAWPDGLQGVIALPYPGGERGAAVTIQDNGYSIITASGAGRDYPPGDEEGFRDFLRSTMTPVLWEIVSQAEPQTGIVTTRTSANRLRAYHRMPRRPRRFLPIGDALVALNPAYGQGMTTGALQSRLLTGMLGAPDADVDDVVSRFPVEVVELNAFAWGVATSSDMRFPTTEADGMPQPSAADLEAAAYMEHLQRAATVDAWLVGRLQGAIGSMDPTALFAEGVRRRVAELEGRQRPAWSTDLSRTSPLQPEGTPA